MNNRIKYLKSLAKRRATAGVLIFNSKNELLILKLSYKDYWGIPGGCVDEGEHLLNALNREVKEEIGISINLIRCVVVDSKIEKIDNYFDESLQFVFLSEKITDDQIKKIKIDNKEIIDFKFMKSEKAFKVLNPKMVLRIKNLNGNYNDCIFLENGKKCSEF
ncbi:NUDIX domain-containing protein [Candidatus Parcubacteria bacterium]|nr:NUDIX domain-containing protein [Candidatus Parcubacteria bacterium]